jgi:hypothetical protein
MAPEPNGTPCQIEYPALIGKIEHDPSAAISL